MKYYVTIANQEHCVAITQAPEGHYACQIDDGPVVPVSMSRAGNRLNHISNKQTAIINIALDSGDVSMGGARRLVSVESAMLRAQKSASGSDAGGAGDGTIVSPMPGRVVKNLVSEGDRVTSGQGVVVIEAMKMENELKASIDCVVTKLHTESEDLVESGAPLIEITPDA